MSLYSFHSSTKSTPTSPPLSSVSGSPLSLFSANASRSQVSVALYQRLAEGPLLSTDKGKARDTLEAGTHLGSEEDNFAHNRSHAPQNQRPIISWNSGHGAGPSRPQETGPDGEQGRNSNRAPDISGSTSAAARQARVEAQAAIWEGTWKQINAARIRSWIAGTSEPNQVTNDFEPHNSQMPSQEPPQMHNDAGPETAQHVPNDEPPQMPNPQNQPREPPAQPLPPPSDRRTGAHLAGYSPPRRRTGRPKRRDPSLLCLAQIVREELERLVDYDNQIDPKVSTEARLGYKSIATQPTVNGMPREATSEDDFKFDVLGTRSSPWNKSAGRVFARIVMRERGLPNTYESFNCLQSAFASHLETIIRRYKASQTAQHIRLRSKTQARRRTRRTQLFLKRHQTAHQFPLLQKHIPMLEELGPDGMSSDESDRGDKELTRYRIHSPAWRADAVGSWLRTFDTISTIFRRETGAGANPRIRNPTQRKSDRKEFVPGLPINVYDPSWLERDARRKYDLYPAQETYDFTHAPRIIDLAMDYVNSQETSS